KGKVIINQVRAFYFMAGILKHQEEDPRCAVCKSRKKVAEDLREEFERFKQEVSLEEIPELFRGKVEKIQSILDSIKLPAEPIPQRKVGACHFPDEECLIKEAYEIVEEVVEEKED
ncbi:MAG: hypothetical protein ACK4UR_00175, partial [Caldimicrobium sp.]